MLRTLSDEIAVNLKDRLRDVRYVIRRARQSSRAPETSLPAPEALLGHAAGVMDTALTAAEAISISIISSEPAKHHGAPQMRSLSFYFGTGAEGARGFRSDMYYFLKGTMRRYGLENALIHEAAFSVIHGRLLRKHAELLRDPLKVAQALAALYLEALAESPVRLTSLEVSCDPENLRKAEVVGLAAACLACGLATVKPADLADIDPLESVFMVLEARYERLVDAAETHDAKKLETLFATLIAHLP